MRSAVRAVQSVRGVRVVGSLLLLGGTLAMAATGARADPRPSAVAMGVSATVEGAPFADELVGLPVSIDAGTLVAGETWWHASATFGAARIDDGSGHTFELQTGPRVRHCFGARFCIGASLELGWGHSRWDLDWRGRPISYDDVHLEARVRAAVALSPTGRVLLEASGGPRARYYLRAIEDELGPADHVDEPLARGLAAGLALVVRN